MLKPFSSLFGRIVVWFFLNLAVVTTILLLFFIFQSRIDFAAFFGRYAMDKVRTAGMMISHDLHQTQRTEWAEVLKRHSGFHHVDFVLLLNDGTQYFSNPIDIPGSLRKSVAEGFPKMPPPASPQTHPTYRIMMDGPGPPDRNSMDTKLAVRQDRTLPKPRLMVRTKNPTRYWAWIWIPPLPGTEQAITPVALLAVSDSITGNGFFFEPLPWMLAAAMVLCISVVLWIPLVKSITRPLAAMIHATEQIARGDFEVDIPIRRTDEIGRLSVAINNMAGRLRGFVKGQRRFLGDAAHELGSPIARIQVGLGILERQLAGRHQRQLADVVEDVTQMSHMVNELLSFSRAEMDVVKVRRRHIALGPLVQQVIQRESLQPDRIVARISPTTFAVADPELLSRALANLLRNALKYAGEDGPVWITASSGKDSVVIEVRDAGPGVPEEFLPQLFEPFFRPEPSRDRDSGGVGLGLAIVKTCVEACHGSVTARNLDRRGFAVAIVLEAGYPQPNVKVPS